MIGGVRSAPRRAGAWLVLLGAVTLLAGVLQRLPCHLAGWPGDYSILMGDLCYSDIPLLYRDRVFYTGDFPFSVDPAYRTLEYPVLTGFFADFAARLARLVSADPTDIDAVSVTFYEVNAVLLIACGLVAVWATARVVGRTRHALMLALAPSLALTSLINWDLFAVMLAALAIYFWARSMPVVAGVFIGLGFAAKLYPVLLLGPLLVLCLRSGKLKEYAGTLIATVVTWAAVNLPVALISPQGWAEFWVFNQSRGGEFGSIWYLFALAGDPVIEVNQISLGIFLAACLGVAVLGVRAPRRPRVAQLCFLVLAAFLVVNKVYSPQYVLWLLPFVVLARPSWRDWAIWQLAEVTYWVMIWMHIGGYLGEYGWLYDAATLLRILATLYVAAMVVRDILHPERDLGTDADGDDPAGGVLVGVGDALPGWLRWLGPPQSVADRVSQRDPALA